MKNVLPQQNVKAMKKMLMQQGMLLMDADKQVEIEIENFTAIATLDALFDGNYHFEGREFVVDLTPSQEEFAIGMFEEMIDTFMPEDEIRQELMGRAVGARYMITHAQCALLPKVAHMNHLRMKALIADGIYSDEVVKKAEKIAHQAELWSKVEAHALNFTNQSMGALK
ncbi:hypothetical protein [Bacillus wiedmannii]|uniref:Uncharacterized protein n=1 Tax=Bacillus wiedmannii TaxID=1890302 RepID=A0AA95LUS4_9BACI|nr:hypothetical protein [Bacillus wiedmannii]WHY28118.1 hypothetical protein QNH45_21895 [Bacillus wiedmannii]